MVEGNAALTLASLNMTRKTQLDTVALATHPQLSGLAGQCVSRLWIEFIEED